MPVYRPRMKCMLAVPDVVGQVTADTVNFTIRARSATVTLNDHNHADELLVEAEWGDVGVDPRLVKHGIIKLWMGNAKGSATSNRNLDFYHRENFTPSNENLRFHGVVDTISRAANAGGGQTVSIKARDFTSFFLANKPYPSAGQPSYTDTLPEVWQQICDHTGRRNPETGKIDSSVKLLRNALEFRGGVDPGIVLGKAVSERFARVGKVPTRPQSDAWAVWQQCIGMLGLVSWIDRGRCIVTTSTDLFVDLPELQPAFTWGRNILDMSETANSHFSDKGVALTSFDPLTGTTIEERYPEPGELQRKQKKLFTKKGKPTKATDSEHFDYFEFHGVTDPEKLHEIAKRAYLERSMQELEGHIKTSEMHVPTVGTGQQIDLLSTLRAGVSIGVKIDPIDHDVFSTLSTYGERIEYLLSRGYNAAAAEIIVNNAAFVLKQGLSFLVRQVAIHLSADGDSGDFSIEVGYVNRYELA